MELDTAYEALGPLLKNEEPVALSQPVLIRRLAARFRWAAARWRSMRPLTGASTPRDAIMNWATHLQRCGESMIAAFRAGALPDVAGLHQLIAWHTADASNDPRNVIARTPRCPISLFHNFVGGNLVPVRIEQGRVEILGPNYGGIAPRLEPGILDLPENERNAVSCELLADLIESGNGAGPAQPVGQPPRSLDADEAGGPDLPVIDAERMAVRFRGVECRFPARHWRLFQLSRWVLERPGRRVSFETLREPGGPWADRDVVDSTIRGAVSRLRDHLREHELKSLAAAISIMSDSGKGYVLFDPAMLASATES